MFCIRGIKDILRSGVVRLIYLPVEQRDTTSSTTTSTTDDRWNEEGDAEFIVTLNSTILAQIKVYSKLR